MIDLLGEIPPAPPKRAPLIPKKNGAIHDIVVTPEWLAKRIVNYYRPKGVLLDPARGSGPFYRAMLAYSNDVRWCEIAAGRDFFRFHEPVDWIITSPPYSRMRDFIKHAMELAPDIVFMGAISQFVLKARLRDMQEAGYGFELLLFKQPPPPWPAAGFQTAVMHLKRGAPMPFKWLPEE